LTALKGLENIPEVSISDCKSIVDFTGLDHHQKLTVDSSFDFLKMAKEFLKAKKHSELFETIEHLYFLSESSSTPKCIW
jgi:hypothetical protein